MALDPVSAVLEVGGKLIDRLWPDPAQRDAAKLEMLRMQQSGELLAMTAQTDTNKVEAASASLFVAGWRPFIGWTCGAAFGYKFVLAPAAVFVLAACGHPVTLPVLDFSEMSPVLLGMLGIGGLRTLEKIKGVA